MNDMAIKKALHDLSQMILALPNAAQRDTQADSCMPDLNSRMSADEPCVDDYLAMIKLQVKYLLFDLEATRRENKYLRRMLEARPRGEGLDSDSPGI